VIVSYTRWYKNLRSHFAAAVTDEFRAAQFRSEQYNSGMALTALAKKLFRVIHCVSVRRFGDTHVHNPLFRFQQRRAARAFLCCIELRNAITL
jgi:hypothetical protein